MDRKLVFTLAVAAVSMSAASASAQSLLYSTFGPGQTYAGGSVDTLTFSNEQNGQDVGILFTAPETAFVTSIDIAIDSSGSTNPVSVWFSAGGGANFTTNADNQIYDLTQPGYAIITKGSSYLLTLQYDGYYGGVEWDTNPDGLGATLFEDFFQVGYGDNVSGYYSGTAMAFSIYGDIIPTAPEPATWSMLLLGFGLVGGAIRRGRKSSLAPLA